MDVQKELELAFPEAFLFPLLDASPVVVFDLLDDLNLAFSASSDRLEGRDSVEVLHEVEVVGSLYNRNSLVLGVC